jgi:hypothetical protein
MANENQVVQFFHPVADSILRVSLFQCFTSKEITTGYKTVGSLWWKKSIPVVQDKDLPTVKFRVTKHNHGCSNTLEEKVWETDTIPKDATQRMGYWLSWAKTNGFVQTPE